MKQYLLAAALCGVVSSVSAVGASATGTYAADPAIAADGIFPTESTYWADSTSFYWYGQEDSSGVVLTLDLGTTVSISQLLVSVDNNDTYQFDASIDGMSWSPLWAVDAVQGNVGWGMDTVSSDPSHGEFSGVSFAPLDARYVRAYASTGDGMYAIGEIELTTAATVPEPASVALLLAGIGLVGAQVRRRR